MLILQMCICTWHNVEACYTLCILQVNIARPKAVLNAVKGNQVNTARPKAVLNVVKGNQGNPQQDLQEKGVIDSECSRHIIGNISYLTHFKEIDEGYVAFGGNPKGEIQCRGSGPNWLFDIDALTKSMNYKPVVAGNQSNGNAGTKSCDDTGDDENEVTAELEKEVGDPSKEGERDDQENEDSVNSTYKVNIVSSTVNVVSTNEVNTISENISNELLFDPNMPALEDISIFDFLNYDEDDGAVADMNNLDTTIQVSPIPTTRIHKDHPLDQVIGDLHSATQTRRMSKNLEEHGFKNPKRLVAQWYTQEEGIDYDEVLAPVARIEAIRLLLAYASFKDFVVYQMDVKSDFLYGKIDEEVYVCQPPGFEDPDFPDRVYKVEKVLYGLHQAPRAWYETLSTYLLDNGFQRGKIDKTLFIRRDKRDILLVQVYVDDIIFCSTKKELCTQFEKMMHKMFQMCSMGELTFFLGQQTTSTPMETNKPLLKDEDGEEGDVHLYRSMISSLMYLTSSRPDIMFAVFACARYQVNPKVSLLHAVKRNFKYLKGQPKLGLWYPKDSPFDLVAYTDSDYDGASLDRKSTIGGCQFLGCRLISWQCKKQNVVANSTTKAEYVAASSCCGQTCLQKPLMVSAANSNLSAVVTLSSSINSELATLTYTPAALTVYKQQ
ncbi:putative ribonuclease H-like domain-containing protein [Tanacetum coccineum]